MPRIQAKICGLNDSASVKAAVTNKADYIGLVFFPKSPRAVTPKMAADLAQSIPDSIKIVGLFVNPDDTLIQNVLDAVKLDMIQLHGSEKPARVAEIRAKYDVAVMKAIPIAGPSDLNDIKQYEDVADMLLFDAKAPKSMTNALPGGNGLVFDWRMLQNLSLSVPWMLAGGLTEENVEEAVTISGAGCVDTSSGVEVKPGQKDPDAIARFIKTVHEI